MQDLNHDMEDLLRRAAEAYPLKQGEDKWDEIALQLQPRSETSQQKKQWHPKKFLSLMFLLCLLFTALVLNRSKEQSKLFSQAERQNSSQQTVTSFPVHSSSVFQRRHTEQTIISNTATKLFTY